MNEDNAGLWKAMLATQKKLEHATLDSKNPHFKSRYASLNSVLDAVKPVANENGLVVTQLVEGLRQDLFPDMIVVKTRVTHADTGAYVEDNQTVPLPKKDPQGLGSAITYARRYGLTAIFGIGAEDDDANAASTTANRAPGTPVPVFSFGGAAGPVAAAGKGNQASPEQTKQLENKLTQALGFKKA